MHTYDGDKFSSCPYCKKFSEYNLNRPKRQRRTEVDDFYNQKDLIIKEQNEIMREDEFEVAGKDQLALKGAYYSESHNANMRYSMSPADIETDYEAWLTYKNRFVNKKKMSLDKDAEKQEMMKWGQPNLEDKNRFTPEKIIDLLIFILFMAAFVYFIMYL